MSDEVDGYLRGLQEQIVSAIEGTEPSARFMRDAWTKEAGPGPGGLVGEGLSCVLEGGCVIERGAVLFSRIEGEALPAAATAKRPDIVGKPYVATGVSVVMHPKNPHVPTSHMNVRSFSTKDGAAWWFGGGFDLTPYYPVDADVLHWHQTAKGACDPFGPGVYPTFKERCDAYFVLKHRGETRGVGGLFFDDLTSGSDVGLDSAARCFSLMRSIGDAYVPAYLPIVERRRHTPYGERERAFQLVRRGRYVEFNLVYDRGTLFGLQSGGRTESILASMPPLCSWRYDDAPKPGSEEARLASYLKPRDWLRELGDDAT